MIYLASDHAGLELKTAIAAFLDKEGKAYTDIGPHEMDPLDDYPDFIIPAAQEVAKDSANLGIIFGGSGQGEALAANKVKGVRAALFYGGSHDIVELSKTHNNANILSLGARFIDENEAIKVVKLWLDSTFVDEERHVRRLNKVSDFETNQ